MSPNSILQGRGCWPPPDFTSVPPTLTYLKPLASPPGAADSGALITLIMIQLYLLLAPVLYGFFYSMTTGLGIWRSSPSCNASRLLIFFPRKIRPVTCLITWCSVRTSYVHGGLWADRETVGCPLSRIAQRSVTSHLFSRSHITRCCLSVCVPPLTRNLIN